MLTSEQIAEIRARCEAYTSGTWDWDKWPNGIKHIVNIDIPALLDEITRLRGEIEKANLYALETCDYGKICTDRDRWKARAEALERVSLEMDGMYFNKCSLCIHFGDIERWQKEDEGCIECVANDKDQYVFDQQRFGGAAP